MTKIDIFSGFLGAGKTTLIKKLIAEAYTGEQLVLIENEFGEIGIDGGFLQEAGINITEMNSGCICCSCSIRVGWNGLLLNKSGSTTRHTASSRRHQLLFPVDRIISIAAASLDHQCAVCTHRNLVPGIAHGVAGLCLYGIRHDLRRQAVFAVLRPRNTGGLP